MLSFKKLSSYFLEWLELALEQMAEPMTLILHRQTWRMTGDSKSATGVR